MNGRGSEYSKRYREKKKKEFIDSQELIESLKEQHRQLIMANTSQSDKIQNLQAEQESLKEQIRQLGIENTSLRDTITNTFFTVPLSPVSSPSNQVLNNSPYACNTTNGNTPLTFNRNLNTLSLSSAPPDQEISEINTSSSNQLSNSPYNRNIPDQNLSELFSFSEMNTSSNQEPPYTDFTNNVLDQNFDSYFTTLYLANLF
ncbi:1430_t:CDS:2 [Ambispora gerdemannii]|uniref:1430_t:CDS:1 n=1 Tax=Ambispora gerdemannii TaxID=144530 RepID=A0A9N8WKE6_9GLOM|nr:1430_t:CDS:2 [Ambispora gerdemannii]